MLRCGCGFSFERGDDRVVQSVIGDGVGILPVVVDAAFIGELVVGIEDKTVGSAASAVGCGDFLRRIMNVGEWKPLLLGADLHAVKGILCVGSGIVAVNENEQRAVLLQFHLQRDETILVRLRVGAVIAGEDNHTRLGREEILGIDFSTKRIRQMEGRHSITQLEYGGIVIDQYHTLEGIMKWMKRHFTATAFIVHEGTRTLLLWHRRLSRWMPPGGHVEPDEMPEETAKRECKEETGLDVEIIGDAQGDIFQDAAEEGRVLKKPFALLLENIPASPARNEPAHQHMDFVYLARMLDPSQAMVLAQEEANELKWFTAEEIRALPNDKIFRNVRSYALSILEA